MNMAEGLPWSKASLLKRSINLRRIGGLGRNCTVPKRGVILRCNAREEMSILTSQTKNKRLKGMKSMISSDISLTSLLKDTTDKYGRVCSTMCSQRTNLNRC